MAKDAEDSAPSNGYVASVRKGIDQLRETAKWIIGIFGSLGAVLVAGTQLSGIGTLDTADERFTPAVVAAAAGLICTGIIIWSATRILVSRQVSLVELATEESRWKKENKPRARLGKLFSRFPDINYAHDVDLLGDFESIGALLAERKSIEDLRIRAIADEKILNDPKRGDEHVAARQRFDQAVGEIVIRSDRWKTVQEHLFAGVAYNRVRRLFERMTRIMFLFGASAAVAIAVFAWAVNPPDPDENAGAVSGTPASIPAVGALLDLTEEGRERYEPHLGAQCVAASIPVLVLNMAADNIEVVSIESDQCRSVRFHLTSDIGTLRTP